MSSHKQNESKSKWSRRDFLTLSLGAGAALASGAYAWHKLHPWESTAEVLIAKASNYRADFASLIRSGLEELGIGAEQVKDKSILLKPNLVEPTAGAVHICTHPMVVQGAAEAFLHLGAAKVLVGEGGGHNIDIYRTLDGSGLTEIISHERLPFVDLNNDELVVVPNLGKFTDFTALTFPATWQSVDWVVSLAKLKTHHWAGLTLSMKNLFGLMPGAVYGWPKNVLHYAGIHRSILDICATAKPHLAIVDGVVGMEGDGPIMGDPRPAGLLVMGRNLTAVDATCARLMGVDPHKVPYLSAASGYLGPIREPNIEQRGENIAAVKTSFRLRQDIPAQKALME